MPIFVTFHQAKICLSKQQAVYALLHAVDKGSGLGALPTSIIAIQPLRTMRSRMIPLQFLPPLQLDNIHPRRSSTQATATPICSFIRPAFPVAVAEAAVSAPAAVAVPAAAAPVAVAGTSSSADDL